MSKWRVWKSEPVNLWWAMERACEDADSQYCVCRSFNTWHDAMSYVKGYLGASA